MKPVNYILLPIALIAQAAQTAKIKRLCAKAAGRKRRYTRALKDASRAMKRASYAMNRLSGTYWEMQS